MMSYMLKFRIRYEKYPIPDNVNKGNGAVSKNYAYILDIILHLHIVYILKGNFFFILFWGSFYFYC